jgi:hypothetical protein
LKEYNIFTAEIKEPNAQVATYASLADQIQLMRYVEDVWQVKFSSLENTAEATQPTTK